jgi:hypothetical protein
LKISDCGLRWVCIYYSKLQNGIDTQLTPDAYLSKPWWSLLHLRHEQAEHL